MITFSDPKSKYFGLYHDLRMAEFTSVEYALKSGAFVVIEQVEKIRTNGIYNNTWLDYNLHDSSGICPSLSYANWKLEIQASFGGSVQFDKTQVDGFLIDPNGKKLKFENQGNGLDGIKSLFHKIAKMSAYENHQNFELSQRIMQLESEVSELKLAIAIK